MKPYIITIVIGVLAIGGFFAWQSASIHEAPPPVAAPVVTKAAPAPAIASTPVPEDSLVPPAEEPDTFRRSGREKPVVEQRIIVVGQDMIVKNGRTINPADFQDRADFGDIEGAINKFRTETDPDIKLAFLNDLATQPAESPEIQAVLLECLQSDDKETRIAAYDTILAYEDPTMVPALQKLLEKSDLIASKDKVNDLIELLQARPYREVYYESKKAK